MRSAVLILPAFVLHAHAEDSRGKLVDRMIATLPLQRKGLDYYGLDKTMLGKPARGHLSTGPFRNRLALGHLSAPAHANSLALRARPGVHLSPEVCVRPRTILRCVATSDGEKLMVTGMERSNFLSKIMMDDLESGKHKAIVTRFPPEPNGYLHIGHAKSICVNFGLGEMFNGTTFMRFDDTNPEKEEQEYIDAIMKDVKWLGFDWKVSKRLTHASDYFDQFFEYALLLIKEGKAYVDSLSAEEMREYRGTLTKEGKDSPYRTRSVEENLDLFAKMAAGEVAEGEMVLRLKIDMQSGNLNMRDPTIYRVKRDAVHPRTGDKWKIYPMYDYAHALTDAQERITHSLCTLEFEDHRPLYDWIVNNLPVPAKPRQIEFSRLNLQYCVVSKRKLIQLVNEGHVNGWDDPRMPTLCGLRRRGVPPAALRLFIERTGVSKAENNIDYSILEDCMRETLEPSVPRAFAVLDPIRVVVTTWPEGEVDMLEGPMNPNRPELGNRQIPFSGKLLIERKDYEENPPPKYFRLKPGGEVRLRFAYVIKLDEVIKDENGKVVELRVSHKSDTRQGAGKGFEGKKVKGIIHWLSEDHCKRVNVNLYDRLFNAANPGADHEDGDFLKDVNPNSLKVLSDVAVEPYVADLQPGERVQFERNGFFIVDEASTPGAPTMNRIVALRETWATKGKGDGRKRKTGAGTAGTPAPSAKVTPAPSAKDVDQAAIDAVGDQIRALKEKLKGEGLSGKKVNAQPEVVELVEKLKVLKAR